MIIFLVSGHARTSPFNIDVTKRNASILKSYDTFLFTEKFKSTYNYKVYITTDDMHLTDTITYFTPQRLGNIHLLNTGYYLKEVQSVPEPEQFLEKYRQQNFNDCQIYDGSIYQHHKLLDCYNLFRQDNVEASLIIRMRPDVILTHSIVDIIESFDPTLKICCHWDLMAIGKPDIMKCYCTGLENKYGSYTYKTRVPFVPPIMNEYSTLCKKRWTYAAERQLFEMLFEYCNEHAMDLSCFGSVRCCQIVR